MRLCFSILSEDADKLHMLCQHFSFIWVIFRENDRKFSGNSLDTFVILAFFALLILRALFAVIILLLSPYDFPISEHNLFPAAFLLRVPLHRAEIARLLEMHLTALIFNVYLFKSSQHLRDNTMLRHIRADIIIEMLV